MDLYKKLLFAFLVSTALLGAQAQSPESKTCLSCHQALHPGIVADWQNSRHAQTTLSEAFSRPKLSRRISLDKLPEESQIVVGCYECHGLNPNSHGDNFSHYGFSINIVVTPSDCAACHPIEVKEYSGSKKANAHLILKNNPLYQVLLESIDSIKTLNWGKIVAKPASTHTKNETCYGCHGTEVSVEGVKQVQSAFGLVQVPNLVNWPSQGVGRINPDGSLGSCTSCHPRHSFDIAIARQPATCGQCHLEPDVPAYNVYKESKHGNIYEGKKSSWNLSAVPWQIGADFTAPTCAVCHNSMLVDAQGKVLAQRSHDFGSRLWTRIFGLITSHPQPKSGETFRIRNADGQPLATTFGGVPASDYLLSPQEQQQHQRVMTAVCLSCHSSQWVDGYLERFENTVHEADAMVLTATELMQKAWSEKPVDGSNPFDELSELHWVKQWVFYANSLRYGSAMMGADYTAFKNGWWALNENLRTLENLLQQGK